MFQRLLLVSLFFLTACSGVPDITSRLSPYRIDVRQGNYATQDMVAKLKPGMTQDQVRFVMGTPLVSDMFHGNRWDYVYRFQPGQGETQLRRVFVLFEEGRLTRVGGDVVANGDTAVSEATPTPATRVIEVPAIPAK